MFACGPIAVDLRSDATVLAEAGLYFPRMPDRADAADLVYLSGWCAPAEVALRATGLTRAPSGLTQGHPELVYQHWDDTVTGRTLIPVSGAPHLIQVGANNRSVKILAADPATLARTAVRVLRQLAIRHTERSGGLLGHAAAVAIGDRIVLLAGRPGAGKTTVALHLARRGARLCAGDRTLLLPGPPAWRAVELPLAWRVGPGTLNALHLLEEAEAGRPRHRGTEMVEGKHEFTPGELAASLGTGRITGGTLAAIVVLRQHPHNRDGDVRLSANPEAALRGSLFRPQDALFGVDWFGLGLPTPMEVIARGAALAEQAPVYEAAWAHHDDLAGLAEQIADLTA